MAQNVRIDFCFNGATIGAEAAAFLSIIACIIRCFCMKVSAFFFLIANIASFSYSFSSSIFLALSSNLVSYLFFLSSNRSSIFILATSIRSYFVLLITLTKSSYCLLIESRNPSDLNCLSMILLYFSLIWLVIMLSRFSIAIVMLSFRD